MAIQKFYFRYKAVDFQLLTLVLIMTEGCRYQSYCPLCYLW